MNKRGAIPEPLAAIKIQSAFRGFLVRKKIKDIEKLNAAALKIQNCWRRYRKYQKINKIKEIAALKKITRAVKNVRRKKEGQREMERLRKFDHLLQYYPAKSRPSTGTAKRSPTRKKASHDNKPEITKPNTARSSASNTPLSTARQHTSRPMMATKKPKERKRKELVKLPPPWHDKDPRRISQSQQDELMFQQRNNYGWAKNELWNNLMKKCETRFQACDQLIAKNEKFRNRTVNKIFGHMIPRTVDNTFRVKNARCVTRIGDTNFIAMCSSQAYTIIEIVGTVEDKIVQSNVFSPEIPFLDVVLNPRYASIIGIDCNWNLCLYEGLNLIHSINIKPPKVIPLMAKYLSYDKFGMLWVNLFRQDGDLFCVDPLTLQICYQVNFSTANRVHRILNQTYQIIPISCDNTPIGFAAVFDNSNTITLYSVDFSSTKTLRKGDLEGKIYLKQSGNRLFAWSDRRRVCVYELDRILPKTEFIGQIRLISQIIDVDAITEPDLIVVCTEDNILHAFLGNSIEYMLRLPDSRLSDTENRFADKLLGKLTVTNSRKQFAHIVSGEFTHTPTAIHVSTIAPKLAIASIALSDGHFTSMLITTTPVQIKAKDYDNFNYETLTKLSNDGIDTLLAHFKKKKQERDEAYGEITYFQKIDEKAIKGSLSALFLPEKTKFSIVEEILANNLRKKNPFIPHVLKNHTSAYEVFHFFRRADILPKQISTFKNFVCRFCPKDMLQEPPQIQTTICRPIPVKTTGIYNSIVDISFPPDRIAEIERSINPLIVLNNRLKNFTLVGIEEKLSKTKRMTELIWWSNEQRTALQERVSKLSKLEDLVKHEILRRKLDKTSEIFRADLSPLNSSRLNDQEFSKCDMDLSSVNFGPTPHRNPLLDENMHKSIYENWALSISYGTTKTKQHLISIILPRDRLDTPRVRTHFEKVSAISNSTKGISSKVYGAGLGPKSDTSQIVITQVSQALPLSHFLTIHSFLGSDNKKVVSARSILTNVLMILKRLHQNNVICRSVTPSNILLDAIAGTVTIGNIYDSQINGIHLPLPSEFSNPSNPYLPPEFFHKPSREHTTAFDMWQFGVLLFYIITGSPPPAYGSEYLRSNSEYSSKPGADSRGQTKAKIKRVVISEKSFLEDPPIHPETGFFYDWLKGSTVVTPGERYIGENGECFLVSDKQGPPTILDTDYYRIVPFRYAKDKPDESRQLMNVIELCLQIDPSKRPTAAQLLRYGPFQTAAQSMDVLEEYMKTPDPNVFYSQFFAPVLNALDKKNFRFAMGIINALVFSTHLSADDAAYMFPLDKAANLEVVDSLFRNNFLDTAVSFVIKKVSEDITQEAISFQSNYTNDLFDDLVKFFEKFMMTVEHGQGPLMPYVNDVVNSLYSLYTVNPQMRYPSSLQALDLHEFYTDSATMFVFTHQKIHSLVLFAAQGSSYIANALKKSVEHNDAYFEQFINFGENVYQLANAISLGNEKQRCNSIKTLMSYWNNGQSLSIVRLFVDYKVPQKIIQCLSMPNARADVFTFYITAMRTYNNHPSEPPFILVKRSLEDPRILMLCDSMLRDPRATDGSRQPIYEMLKLASQSERSGDIIRLVTSDSFSYALENAGSGLARAVIDAAIDSSSTLLMDVMMTSHPMIRCMALFGIEFVPKIDSRAMGDNQDLVTTVVLMRRLCVAMLVRNSNLPSEVSNAKLPSVETSLFIRDLFRRLHKEANSVLTARKIINPHEMTFSQISSKVSSICENIVKTFKVMRSVSSNSDFPELFEFLRNNISNEVVHVSVGVHPSINVRWAMIELVITAMRHSKWREEVKSAAAQFPQLILNDLVIIANARTEYLRAHMECCFCKDRELYKAMLKCVMRAGLPMDALMRPLVRSYLHNTASFSANAWNGLRKELRFPVRTISVDLVSFILRWPFGEYSALISKELEGSGFLESERRLVDATDNAALVDSSFRMVSCILSGQNFSPHFSKQCASFYEALQARFVRRWKDIPFLDVPRQSRTNAKKKSPFAKESWRRPITTLDGKPSALVFAPGSKPTAVFL